MTVHRSSNSFGDLNVSSDGTLLLGDIELTRGSIGNFDIAPATLTSGGTDDYGLYVERTLNDAGAAGGDDAFTLFGGSIIDTDTTGWDDVYLIDVYSDSDSGGFSVSADGSLEVYGNSGEVNMQLVNDDPSDADAGRLCYIEFGGALSTDPESSHSLAKIRVTHEGTGTDEKGQMVIVMNDGNDGYSPSVEALKISSAGVTTLKEFVISS
jgi:hypothetical protein